MTIEAPAKINLTLDILGKRADGYHELRSVVCPVSLYDTITVTPRSDSTVTCETVGEGVDAGELATLPLERQLAVKALRVMQRICGFETGADIRVVKRIPIGAGMGGGSADAAGVIRAAARIVDYQLSIVNCQLFAEVGSDVPALVLGGLVLMEGRGERVTPLPAFEQPMWFVIAFPGFAVSTKNVYGEFRNSAIPQLRDSAIYNDLEETVFRLYPEVRRVRDLLLECGAGRAMVSGSGSAVFGVAENGEDAGRIQSRLPNSLWTRVVKSV